VSSANRERRLQNREARMVAEEERLRRTKRQRFLLALVGLGLAIIVGVVLVARAVGKNDSGKAARSTSTTSGTPTTVGAPTVPVQVGPPPTKLVKVDLKKGTGAIVKPSSTVTLDYIGVACSTGKIFDSSYQRNQPLTTAFKDVIPGWQQGIPGMKVGGSRLLGIPPALGYRSSGFGADIAPDETLWFVVKVNSTK